VAASALFWVLFGHRMGVPVALAATAASVAVALALNLVPGERGSSDPDISTRLPGRGRAFVRRGGRQGAGPVSHAVIEVLFLTEGSGSRVQFLDSERTWKQALRRNKTLWTRTS
jgi:hypothetical protein